MPARYGFYDSDPNTHDRVYGSVDFARIYKQVFGGDGVFVSYASEFRVHESSPPALSCAVEPGMLLVDGRWFELYSVFQTLMFNSADPTLPRNDLIIVRSDTAASVRSAVLTVKPGVPATTPLDPPLTNSGTINEYAIARVRVGAAALTVLNANITDLRTWVGAQRAYANYGPVNQNVIETFTASSGYYYALQVGTEMLSHVAVASQWWAGTAVGDGVITLSSIAANDLWLIARYVRTSSHFIAGGSIGSGGTVPAYALHIAGNAHISTQLGVGTAPDVNYSIRTGGAIYITGAATFGGYVGVQTAPAYPFHVVGNSYFNGVIGVGAAPNASYSIITGGNTYVSGSGVFASVGIATGGPASYPLHVIGNSYISGVLGVGGAPNATYSLYTASAIYITGTSQLNGVVGIGLAPNASYSLITAGTIYSSGNIITPAAVGIGTSPSYTLHNSGTTFLAGIVGIGMAPTGGLALDVNGIVRTNDLWLGKLVSRLNSNIYILNQSGGTQWAPVPDNFQYWGLNGASWAQVASFQFYNSSDRSLKHDIEVIDDAHALDVIRRTPVYTFHYNGREHPLRKAAGIMLDEADELFHTYDGDGISLMNAIAVLMGAVRSLAERVERLEA